MKFTKSLLGVTLSVAMLATQAIPSFAADPEASTTEGSGNILDYTVSDFIVPTKLSIALNPNGLDINLRYHKIAKDTAQDKNGFVNTSTYYKDESGKKVMLMPQPVDAAGLKAHTDQYDVYEVKTGETDNSKIVSLNYGLANKSTSKETVQMSIEAWYDEAQDGIINFVDNQKLVTAYDSSTNPKGAKTDEYKMLLKVVPGRTVKATDQFVDVAKGAFSADDVYYVKKDDGSFIKASEAAPAVDVSTTAKLDEVIDAGGYVYKIDANNTAVGKHVLATNMSDVDMEDDTAGIQVLGSVVGTPNIATADLAFQTDAAQYVVMRGKHADFATTAEELSDMMTIDTIGGVYGFTFGGDINADADWTEAAASAITFTPIYKISKIDEEKTIVTEVHATNAPGVVTVGPQVEMTAAGAIKVSGFTDDQDFAGFTLTYTNEKGDVVTDDYTKSLTWDDSKYWSEATGWAAERQKTATLSADDVTYFKGLENNAVTATLILSDESEKTTTVSFID